MDEVGQLRSKNPRVKRTAVKEIYTAGFQVVLRYVRSNSGTEEDAKDTYHQAWVVLEGKLQNPAFELESPVAAYLVGISKNIWLKQLRRKRRMGVADIEIPETGAAEEEGNLRTKAIQRVMALLADPVFKVCKAVILNYYRGWSMQEIADDRGYSGADTAKSKKAKCMKKLRAICRKDPVLLQLFES